MLNHNHTALIKVLNDCALTCEVCATSCLNEKDVKMMTECIKLDIDCADVCRLTATLLQRDSKIGHKQLSICEEICKMCASECKKHYQIKHCKDCTEMCLKCAEACKEHLSIPV